MHRLLRILVIGFVALSPAIACAGIKAERVVVVKKTKTLSLYGHGGLIASYPVVFGARPNGQKQQEGDKRTPEGDYLLDFKNSESRFYKSIRISYPNVDDIARAKSRGVSPGGAIMIHGQKNGSAWSWAMARKGNWTDGCIALSNKDMEAVWQAVDMGTPIEIRP